jgi:hypothetical protein
VLSATRAARRVEPDQWPRMLELMIDALDARRGTTDEVTELDLGREATGGC